MSDARCAVSAGLLLPRPCENLAVGACSRCSRAVCEQHAALAPAGLLCRACESGSEHAVAGLLGAAAAAAAAAGALALFQPEDVEAFEKAGLEDEPEDAFADLS